ncbi:phosphate ABC transporter, permease protein PstA [Arachidicoccus ginsenosidimutans]|uniref:phosphate ABC transporter permease PstA n=1 Tax=Arachidicoccus sp. BS20 TaxID=1850526 RepID=UPI0007F0F1A5|nr:phosphate ABC transporter permease PstA [Arachidicoccus sp. BS20]ANI90274.1 phosphate ABC transporter, permease protein PstA [Arachidicoccus sp. BS20]
MKTKLNFRIAKSKGMNWLIIALSGACVLPLVFILLYIIKAGIGAINWNFLVNIPKPVGEPGGGIANALIGTAMIILLASVIAVPIGIICGIYLNENKKSKLAYWASICVDVLQGIPSIVIGIIGYLWLVLPFGGHTALSGSVALAIMMLPIIIRSTEETLKLIPDTLKEAAYALGMPFQRVIMKVIIPTGFSGILSGVMLSVARVAGETAPLLFTAFGNPFITTNLLKPMQSLPLLIFNYATSPYTDWQNLAWGASLVLLIFVLALNTLTKLITRRWKVQL